MSKEAQLLVEKFRQMETDLKFLEWVWRNLSEREKNYAINDYTGHVPDRFNKR